MIDVTDVDSGSVPLPFGKQTVVGSTGYKYTVYDGLRVVEIIRKNGYPKAKLIGSLGAGKESNHDIDILIPLRNKKTKQKCVAILMKLFNPPKACGQDWGGFYFSDTEFGDIDFFFSTKNFDYGIK